MIMKNKKNGNEIQMEEAGRLSDQVRRESGVVKVPFLHFILPFILLFLPPLSYRRRPRSFSVVFFAIFIIIIASIIMSASSKVLFCFFYKNNKLLFLLSSRLFFIYLPLLFINA